MLASVSGFARLPDYRDAYFRAPSEAGALLQEAGGPASGQLTAWVAEGVDPVPRWVSYYWGLPVSEAAAAVEGGSVGAGDLVLVCLDRLPRWMHPVPEPFAQRGRYALMTGASLRGKAGPQGRPDRLTAFPGPRSFSKRTPRRKPRILVYRAGRNTNTAAGVLESAAVILGFQPGPGNTGPGPGQRRPDDDPMLVAEAGEGNPAKPGRGERAGFSRVPSWGMMG